MRSELVLFNPRSSVAGKHVLPMSVLAMAAVLEGKHEYSIIDGNLYEDVLAVLFEKVRKSRVDIVAITVMPGRQVRQARDVSLALKAEFSHLSIIWGGYFPTMYESAAATAPYVDFLLRGHSEEPFLALVKAIRDGNGYRNQAGLSYMDRETGNLISNPIGPVPALDGLPEYPYHKLRMEEYVLDTFLGSRTLSHHASYGCPFTCNFCGVVNMVNGRYSAQSPEKIELIVEQLVDRYGANAIQFYDNNFFVSESRSAEICDRLKRFDVSWWAYGRVDTLMKYNDTTWAKMRDSGLRMIYLGAEAGSDDVLEKMNKGGKQTADMTIAIAERMRAHNMIPELSFVIASPPNPDEDIDQTFRFIRRVKQSHPESEIIIYPYSPVPVEGQLFTEAQALGFAFPETLDEWAEDHWVEYAERTTAALPWLSRTAQKKIGNFQRVLNAAYPTVTDPGMTPSKRLLLRAAGMWRFKLQIYANPFELRVINRLFPHQRPEVTGF
ncbi:MAG: B12-binding domain-containing radical SAM protein [Gammaproteobacteria bacterium]|nr:B12-binding domain-containing radical SAM protein [Gammaproteobacteria bacterium]